MNTDTVRLNITLPRKVAQELEKLSGSRNRSQFIAEAVQQKIEKLRDEELKKQLIEGYKATKKESLDLAEEFEFIDLEGWDEY